MAYKAIVTKQLGIWVALTLLLFEKWVSHLNPTGGVTKSCVMVWALICLLISEGYKSTLFSELTVEPNPVVPKTTDELVKWNQTIITTKVFARKDLPHYNMSLLKDSILEDLIQQNSDTDRGHFKQLYDSVILYCHLNNSENNDHISLLYDMMSSNVRNLEIKVCNESIRVRNIKETFSLLDPKSSVQNLILNYRRYQNQPHGSNWWISTPTVDRMLVMREVWMGAFNYFFPIFHRYLGLVYASGMTDKWGALSKEIERKFQADILRNMIEDQGKVTNEENVPVENSDNVPVTVFLQIAYHYFVCILACILSFLGEVFKRFHCNFDFKLKET